jgi:hypothetical protein
LPPGHGRHCKDPTGSGLSLNTQPPQTCRCLREGRGRLHGARLNVYVMLGLEEGDACVIRNAGGVKTEDEICSLAISQRLLGTCEVT